MNPASAKRVWANHQPSPHANRDLVRQHGRHGRTRSTNTASQANAVGSEYPIRTRFILADLFSFAKSLGRFAQRDGSGKTCPAQLSKAIIENVLK
jgi:hypothetical protein